MSLKIIYILDNDEMSDEQFEDQPDRTFVLTEEMIIDVKEKYVKLEKGDSITINHIESRF
jgi:hypothetical protein